MKSLYWFTQDLRLTDNPAFSQIIEAADEIHCIVIQHQADEDKMGAYKRAFLQQSIDSLSHALAQQGITLQRLPVATTDDTRSPAVAVAQAINQYCQIHNIEALHVSAQAGSYERDALSAVKVEVTEHFNQTLWAEHELPFALDELPPTFSKARKLWEKSELAMNLLHSDALKQSHDATLQALASMAEPLPGAQFSGGEQAGLEHLASYFEGGSASFYKQTRNALDGWAQSTKFSPWLALGCISPRQVMVALRQYENEKGANDSTYWIFFELLWREYFFWYARRHRNKLFVKNGLNGEPAYQAKDDPIALKRWQQGQTDFPLVNACMKQLNQTGYMSNRGRQLVASCLVNELQLDWRLGAEYFEQQLIDYDVASNWGNWQYLGGVGADPRGLRRFDQDKQQRQYDPYGEFIKRWQGYIH